jgi:hypothetical protein
MIMMMEVTTNMQSPLHAQSLLYGNLSPTAVSPNTDLKFPIYNQFWFYVSTKTMQISDRITNLQVNIQSWDLLNAKKENSNTQYSTTIFHLLTQNTVTLRNAASVV